VKKRSGRYPRLTVDGHGSSVVPNAGAVLLLRTAEAVGLDAALSQALEPWRRPLARHDPGKILLDLAVSLAVGGDCLADLAQLRTAPEVFGPVASDPTVSRLIDTLAADAPAALAALATARATARTTAWSLPGAQAPDHDASAASPLVIDVDATLVTAHSDKEFAAPTFKARLRLPSAVGLRRPRTRGHRRAAGISAARRQRRLQHRHRPPGGHPGRAGPAARRARPWQEGAGPHRRRRRHP
jgi:hypothetical protein